MILIFIGAETLSQPKSFAREYIFNQLSDRYPHGQVTRRRMKRFVKSLSGRVSLTVIV